MHTAMFIIPLQVHQYRCMNICLQSARLSRATNMAFWHGTEKHWLWWNDVCFKNIVIKYMQEVSEDRELKCTVWVHEQKLLYACVFVCEIPVSIVGNEHSLSDLAFNLLVNYQQHDSIKVQSLALSHRENKNNKPLKQLFLTFGTMEPRIDIN